MERSNGMFFWLVTSLFVIGGLVDVTDSVVYKLEKLPERCDFRRCAPIDRTKLNVHLVPHTHDDVGWLKTVEQYYYGSNNKYQKAGVQYILDSVVQELIRNKDRRFIYVETAFFWKWWQEQDNNTQAYVKELVKSGQLEFINGGWSMADEAATHYNSLIDQTTWGHRRLKDLFGKCGVPRVTWQIDPFGHSRELASLFAQMNFDAVYFAREDYQEQRSRFNQGTLEHVWEGSDDLGAGGDIFTGLLSQYYCTPGGLNWDPTSSEDDPVITNAQSEENNVEQMVNRLVSIAKDFRRSVVHDNVMIPMGCDFTHQNAHFAYKNMDKLIEVVNSRQDEVRVFYSTPSCYTKAIADSSWKTFTGKNDDYFPYANDEHSFWTGYFSSRPALKRYERIGNNYLQACKQLEVLSESYGVYEDQITVLREAMGVMQHHDAITGTEKQHVADNYAKLLHTGITSCQHVISRTYNDMVGKEQPGGKSPTLEQTFCNHLNISSCPITESGQDFAVNFYNPSSQNIAYWQARLPVQLVAGRYFEVYNFEGNPINSSYLIPIPEFVKKIPGHDSASNATHELVFNVNVNGLGLSTYFVHVGEGANNGTAESAPLLIGNRIHVFEKVRTKGADVFFDAGGQLTAIGLDGHTEKEHLELQQSFHYYRGHEGDNHNADNRASGAYVFRPQNVNVTSFGWVDMGMLFRAPDGSAEVQQTMKSKDGSVHQVIRTSPFRDEIELEWTVGPISVEDKVGKEVIIRYQTGLKSNGTFYTDANGRQMMKRNWNQRPSFRYEVVEPVSGNYYPVNSRIALRDETKKFQFTVLTDRSHGGTSTNQGWLELMVHRRLLHDDAYGVNEALNEPGVDGKGLVIRGRHWLLMSSIDQSARLHRPMAQHRYLEPIVSFVQLNQSEYRHQYHTVFQGLTPGVLPPNVHVLTLEKWTYDMFLIRLEHFYQNDEDSVLSQKVSVDLKNLFSAFHIIDLHEMTLSANQDVSALKDRLQFGYQKSSGGNKRYEPTVVPVENSGSYTVELNPFQIRTFSVRIHYNDPI